MSLFRVYVDGALFYHPQMSKLAITDARIEEDAENIDSMTLSAPFNHPYLSSIRPLASTIVCKKGDAVVFEGRALDNGTDFYNTHTWTCESCLAYLKDSVQPPYDYKGTLRGLLELFISVHNNTPTVRYLSTGAPWSHSTPRPVPTTVRSRRRAPVTRSSQQQVPVIRPHPGRAERLPVTPMVPKP